MSEVLSIYQRATLNFNKQSNDVAAKTINLFKSTGVVSAEAKLSVSMRTKYSVSPHLTVDLKHVEEYTELSITGECTVKKNSCIVLHNIGQIQNDIIKYFGNNNHVSRLVEIWNRWNLNGLRPGTISQNKFVKENAGENADFSTCIKVLTDAGLQVDNGYTYGESWLVERLPQEIIQEVVDICKKLS